jgi:hypothetical protein
MFMENVKEKQQGRKVSGLSFRSVVKYAQKES